MTDPPDELPGEAGQPYDAAPEPYVPAEPYDAAAPGRPEGPFDTGVLPPVEPFDVGTGSPNELPDGSPNEQPDGSVDDPAVDPGDTGVRTRAGTAVHRNRRVRRRRRHVFALIGAVVILIIVAFGAWYEVETHPSGPPGKRVVIQVQSGESTGSVLSKLSAKDVIGSTLAFRVFDLVHGSPTILPGDYALRQNQDYSQVHAILAAGPNILAVTVDPGLTLHEVAERVDDLPGHSSGGFAQVASSGVVHSEFSPAGSDNLEGLLGTGNYMILPGESDTSILRSMVTRFDAQATAAGLTTASAAALGQTPYQVIIAASIVEKEGYITKNMPNVARVIYNRLASGTPLQMNATVLYSLGQDGGPFTSGDLTLQTPYNSYLNTGLTPTPICSPSPAALYAAVHPPAGSWLYFVVVKKDGTEAFSDTYAEQLANEKVAQQRGVG